MLQKTLFDIPIWVKEIENFDSMKSKLYHELAKFPPEVRNGTFLSNRNTQRDGLSESFGNIISKELTEFYTKLKIYKPHIEKLWITDVWTVTYEKGDIVIFPSYVLHRVSPVTKGVRHSLVAWANGSAFV